MVRLGEQLDNDLCLLLDKIECFLHHNGFHILDKLVEIDFVLMYFLVHIFLHVLLSVLKLCRHITQLLVNLLQLLHIHAPQAVLNACHDLVRRSIMMYLKLFGHYSLLLVVLR